MEIREMIEIDEELMHSLPVGLVRFAPDRRIEWVNETMVRLLGEPAANLTGRRSEELPAAVQAALATEPQLLHHAATGRWLRREAHGTGDGRQWLITQDTTGEERLAAENARLHQQVEDLKLTDELTGMPNKRAISQALDLHVSRSRRYRNPLSVALVHVDLQPLAGVQPLSTDPVVLAVSRFLRDRLRWVDQIGRWEDNVFLLVLPETGQSDARGLLDKIRSEQDRMTLPEACGGERPRLTFGLACWQKGDDMRTLLRSALHELQADNA